MGKRSNFERRPRDFYPTPFEAVEPLLPHLEPGLTFHEPCAGDGDLIRHLELAGHTCAGFGDIYTGQDAMELTACDGEYFVTNPPWDRKILHPLIERLPNMAPTWLLFDADWMHTKQAAPYLRRCRAIVAVGRVKWIPGSKMTGKDNCCWYLFGADLDRIIEFKGRVGAETRSCADQKTSVMFDYLDDDKGKQTPRKSFLGQRSRLDQPEKDRRSTMRFTSFNIHDSDLDPGTKIVTLQGECTAGDKTDLIEILVGFLGDTSAPAPKAKVPAAEEEAPTPKAKVPECELAAEKAACRRARPHL